MSINGTVTLAISELDELRNKIRNGEDKEKELNGVIVDLQSKQKKVLVELNFTEKVNKAVPKQTTKVVNNVQEEMTAKGLNPFIAHPSDLFNPWETQRFNYPKRIEVLTYQNVVEERLHNKIEYIGFDEVLVDLQLKAEKVVADKITVLTNDNSKLRIENSEIKSANFETNTNVQLAHKKEIEQLVIEYDKAFDAHDKKLSEIIKEKDDELATLKGLEVELSKDSLIKELQAKIAELSKPKKSVWQELWS